MFLGFGGYNVVPVTQKEQKELGVVKDRMQNNNICIKETRFRDARMSLTEAMNHNTSCLRSSLGPRVGDLVDLNPTV